MSCETCGRGYSPPPTIFGRKVCDTCLMGVSKYNENKFNQWLAKRVLTLSKRKAIGLSIVYCELPRKKMRYNMGLRYCNNFSSYVIRYNRHDRYLCEACYVQTQKHGFGIYHTVSDWRCDTGLIDLRNEPRKDWRATQNRLYHEAYQRYLDKEDYHD